MRTSTKRPRLVTDEAAAANAALADRIGTRLKKARLDASLTQQQLAGDRYTKAYVSALENGLVRPSMAALNFFASRLGIPASRLLGDETPAWSRLEADVHLAAGRWSLAADAYSNLLDGPVDPITRAELLRSRAEANARLDDPLPAAADAAESIRLFTTAGRETDAALATYWLAYAQYKQDNMSEARSLMRGVLERVRGGLAVEPDFNLRLLMALSSIESHEGDHARALAYLQEVRAFADQLDDRRRATYLYDLAYAYRETGDTEGAIRYGLQSLALYRASGAEFEMAALENNLALSFLAHGNVRRATELVADSRQRFERLHDDGWLAHVEDTAAQIAIAEGRLEEALVQADHAMETARRTSNNRAFVSAVVTRAKALVAMQRIPEGLGSYEEAANLLRENGPRATLRDVLGQWADVLAKSGQHERAYALTREALSAT